MPIVTQGQDGVIDGKYEVRKSLAIMLSGATDSAVPDGYGAQSKLTGHSPNLMPYCCVEKEPRLVCAATLRHQPHRRLTTRGRKQADRFPCASISQNVHPLFNRRDRFRFFFCHLHAMSQLSAAERLLQTSGLSGSGEVTSRKRR